MKLLTYLRNALPLILVMATGASMAQSTNTALNKDLEAVDSRFFTAVFTTADKPTVEQMLAPGFTFTSGGKTRSRDKFLANLEHMWQQMQGGMRQCAAYWSKAVPEHTCKAKWRYRPGARGSMQWTAIKSNWLRPRTFVAS